MDTTAKEISFDNNGECNFCNHYHTVEKSEVFSDKAGQEKLDLLVRQIKKKGKNTKISVKGRHDPCVGIRAVPIGEAMINCVLLDHFLMHRAQCG
jgi:hypothetical protein